MFNYVRNLASRIFRQDPLALPAALSDVSCRKNPFDIRPAVNAIMAAENWILERIPADQKLVILMGERHSFLTNTILQAAILKSHAARQRENGNQFKFAFGYENPYNTFDSLSRIVHFPEPSCHAASYLYLQPSVTLESARNLFKVCSEEKISVKFNDIACDNIKIATLIDTKDSLTREIIQKYRPDLHEEKNITRASRLAFLNDDNGLALSNLAIVKNAMDHLKQTEARLYIQHCGAAHMFTPKSKRGADYSLVNLFRQQGAHVLPVMTHYEHTSRFIAPRLPERKRTLKIRGLDKGRVAEEDFAELRKKVSTASELEI